MKIQKPIVTLFILVLLLAAQKNIFAQENNGCLMPPLPDISLKKGTVFLDKKGKAALDSVIKIIQFYPTCKVKITGHSESCEFCRQVAWDKTFSVWDYLTKKGLDKNKLVFSFGNEGNIKIVQLQGIGINEDGPSMVPAPHPCFSFHKLTPRRCTDLDGHTMPHI